MANQQHTTTFYIRISNETDLPERIKQAAQEQGISLNQFFAQAAAQMLACKHDMLAPIASTDASTISSSITNTSSHDASMLAPQNASMLAGNASTSMQPCSATPTVPTYTPTDPLDIVAEAFYHQPYATLSFHGKGCCDFIADHPIMGPEMVLDAPPEYIKAGIEYMNNPTPVPIYQPKPDNNSKLTEIINTVNAHRAAKDEAFRQSLIEAETLYPDEGDSFFYCDDDDDVHNEVQDYPEESSEEN